MTPEFVAWPKIPRGQNETITITEKIDGTNACIIIEGDKVIGCQSRKRIIRPGDDNFGFAAWVEEHKEEVESLGDGYHYGEWAGKGIQKNPHAIEGRKFLLFNTSRWNPDNPNRPACCGVVPLLYEGDRREETIEDTMVDLMLSYADKEAYPEGVVVWYHKSRRYEKYTFNTPDGKWAS